MSRYQRRCALSAVLFACAACTSDAAIESGFGITPPPPPALPRSLVTLLTRFDPLADFRQAGGWTQFPSQLRDVGMNLFLPRFRILWDRTLNDNLMAFGMREAFVPGSADFTRISTRGRELSLGVVKQKTLIDINVDGTVAAATAPLAPSTFGFVPLVMRVERPFIVVIHERVSGTIVFMGKVVRM